MEKELHKAEQEWKLHNGETPAPKWYLGSVEEAYQAGLRSLAKKIEDSYEDPMRWCPSCKWNMKKFLSEEIKK